MRCEARTNLSKKNSPSTTFWRKSGLGFTLIEVITAILLIIIGVLGALTLIHQVISFVSISSSRLVAAYLAQEGIEIVRNIRDSNWLEGREAVVRWDEGIDAGEREADYKSQDLTQPFIGDGNFLNIDVNGFYSYSFGSPTKFRRKITISDKNDLDIPPDGEPDQMKVSVEVSWQERGRSHEVSAREDFYRWR